ncbi:HAMP domain-containing protein [Azoarcus communis]|uniref:histidine kinase n=1 Tax=Parazoarcus communis SWub3 = DSM 12120 TaxID=1121029 RepID=A0A323UQE6_9RHOO|nr:ATP-binding protein [Parazoarcus communis]NMG50409.1 HAMP domain-containing protein [Parazoarcus communis]NMG72428.1 HAMP domain-containing protein [Parazoarcus communis SWub3 = DSM 12120]PZA14451.1 PAS domain-containing sensor histidine kinase [Azoarcus communis] [Parazoarcus communis SWub3 = DSM 12120]
MKRIALVLIAAIAGISLFLLASASANSDLFAGTYPYLLAFNGVVVVALCGLVGVQLRALWREYRERQFGSRLKYRMVLMFALMALLPGLVVYAVSLQFVVRSIESWFDVRVDSALEGGIALGQNALDYLVSQVNTKAGEMVLELEGEDVVTPSRLNRLREMAGVSSVTVLAANGHVLATASDGVMALIPDLPSLAQMRQARQTRGIHMVDGSTDGRLLIRVLMPIPRRSIIGEPDLLQLVQPVPETFGRHAEAVQEAYRDYQQLTLGRAGLRRIYTVTLTMTLLLALLGSVAVAFVLTRRLAAPLLILAEGTQAVAQGDYRPRQALPARDELGVLTQSFNQMVRQLEDARAAADRNRAAVESARAYLESVLANLSTGVLAFAPDGTLRAANRGAMDILADDLAGFEDIALAEWPRHAHFRDALLAGFEANTGDWQTQIELPVADSSPLTLLIHGSRLPDATGGGLVVVFDDITRLIDAQRTAAWGEVARRLAHEIKNPLTPIQLSAERLAFKLADRLDDDGRQMLERSTQTIVNQVEAMKNLVNAFRDYARLPAPELQPLDLAALLREVLTLYESAALRIRLQVAEDLPPVLGDASQIRQIIHNMLQNAQDAVAGQEDGEITLIIRRDGDRVLMVFRDNGPGFPAEVLARAFEPYFTTKSKGTGLGLAMVKKIVAEHGGDVRVANRDVGGAEVRIRLRTLITSGEH